MRDLISSGDLMRLFLECDPNTIIRRPNVRRLRKKTALGTLFAMVSGLSITKSFLRKSIQEEFGAPLLCPDFVVLEIVLRNLIRITGNSRLIKQRFHII